MLDSRHSEILSASDKEKTHHAVSCLFALTIGNDDRKKTFIDAGGLDAFVQLRFKDEVSAILLYILLYSFYRISQLV